MVFEVKWDMFLEFVKVNEALNVIKFCFLSFN